MERLKEIAQSATKEIDSLLVNHLTGDQSKRVAAIIEDTVVKALLEGQHRAVDAARQTPDADEHVLDRVTASIRRKNDVLIANLSSLR